ncbi:MAG: 30S ribosomal protein S12 methylthiotransferase RimO [Ruminococcus sp.]|nr:30S ribosomal protein S12 methylthiotransferase RimO [Ruminococcus sp.]
MLGLCQRAGINIIQEEEKADVIIINTCCFIKDALEESIENIIQAGKLKENGNCKGIIVTGCLAQRYEKEIFDELPEIDAVLGTTEYENIVEAVKTVLEGKKVKTLGEFGKVMKDETNSLNRVITTAGHFAYLKIAEGCDSHCTYCVIPSLRGAYRSRTMDSLIEEAKGIASQGVKELILVAQDTAVYGKDIYGESRLHELLEKLCEIDGIEWIRLLYCYPENITDETIRVMAENKKILHYLDMPVQHGSDTVLKRMGRRSTGKLIKEKVAKLRDAMPDIAIRTSIITGFPQENSDEFGELAEFVKEVKFDRLGVFTYSQEEGTPAAEMDGQIPEELKAERKEIIMDIQRNVSAEKCQSFVGKELDVIIEGKLPDDNIYCARSYRDAPEIDGLVFVESTDELLTGDFVKVEITASSDYDLYGSIKE